MSRAEFVSFAALPDIAADWVDLCARACEANPFAEPGFLLPLLAYQRPRRLAFALMRDEGGRLIGFAALHLPRAGLARVWLSPYAALPAGVLDRDRAPEALASLVGLLGARAGLAGLLWPFVESGGPLAAALATLGLPLLEAARRQRAALKLAGPGAFEASLDPKRKSRWARQARKLAAQGKLDEVDGAAAVEAFFALERGGWKGARGTALADDPGRLAFARAALDAFARAGRLEALALRLNGAPVAAGVVLISGARAFYWKTAYDEAHAEASPGVQLALAHSRRLTARAPLAWADSCAAPDHPMIGRVWSDVLRFEDRTLGLRPGRTRALRFWLLAEQAKAHARARLKSLVLGALQRVRARRG